MTTNDTTANGPDVPGDSPANPVTLESLVSSVQPTKKIAKLRQMLPEIDQMQEKGLTNIEIIEALRKVGFVITEQYFSTAVRRLRGERPKPRKKTKTDDSEKSQPGKEQPASNQLGSSVANLSAPVKNEPTIGETNIPNVVIPEKRRHDIGSKINMQDKAKISSITGETPIEAPATVTPLPTKE